MATLGPPRASQRTVPSPRITRQEMLPLSAEAIEPAECFCAWSVGRCRRDPERTRNHFVRLVLSRLPCVAQTLAADVTARDPSRAAKTLTLVIPAGSGYVPSLRRISVHFPAHLRTLPGSSRG